jgi:hypothetical protein
MRILFTLAVIMVLVSSAWAQDNKIRVINEDGTVSEIDLGSGGGAAAPLEPKVKKPAEQEIPAKAPAAAPAKPVEEPAVKTAVQEKKKPKEKAAQTKSKTKSAKSSKKSPPPKPQPVSKPPVKRILPKGEKFTRDEAMAIAIDSTSMIARGLEAYPRIHEGREVWVVVFKTEQGERDILVDAMTGEIVTRH